MAAPFSNLARHRSSVRPYTGIRTLQASSERHGLSEYNLGPEEQELVMEAKRSVERQLVDTPAQASKRISPAALVRSNKDADVRGSNL